MKTILALLGLLLLTACGNEAPRPETTISTASPSTATTAGLVTTRGAVTVIDDGDGAELCLGPVAASLPPQCEGPRLLRWDWSEHRGDFERSRAVSWGAFQVTGTFADGEMAPTEVVALADLDEQPAYDDLRDFASPCPAPDGGWRVVDPALATAGAMQRTLRVASRLDGYAEAWLDQSINPMDGQEGEEAEMAMNDPTRLVVNVRVTGDVDSAEATLRETWGGALCVSKAQHTDAELVRIQRAMMRLPGMLTSDRGDDRVNVTVTYDDGSLQDSLDDEYGEGTVRVESALVPVGGARSRSTLPQQVPSASGPVHTAGLVTVMDTGTPEACLGPVAESYPPQCSGPELVGWDWADHRGMFEEQGDVRWGQFALAGTWDGSRLTATEAIPAALYDARPTEEPTYPEPAEHLDEAELETIRGEVGDLPGAQGAYVDGPRVLVDVTYDDGSIKDWADATYGDGVVVVHSMLVG